MRTDEHGAPLVHRVEQPSDPVKEARMGLDLLLKRAEALRSREAREKAAKAIEDESEAIRQRRIRQAALLAERFEWKPIASVGIFEVQTCCNCGRDHKVFRGWGTRMQRKADPNIRRFVAAPCLDKGLPFEIELLEASAPVCHVCLAEFVADPERPPYTFTPSRRSTD